VLDGGVIVYQFTGERDPVRCDLIHRNPPCRPDANAYQLCGRACGYPQEVIMERRTYPCLLHRPPVVPTQTGKVIYARCIANRS
jgi:hypothetical protein